MLDWIKTYWFLIIFGIGIVSGAGVLKAETTTNKEQIKEVKAALKEDADKTEAELKEKEKTDQQQTIALTQISVTQGYIVETLKALTAEIKK